MNFDQSFEKLIGNEGGYSNNPADPGGETMWGVTKRVAQANGYQGDMHDFTQDQAKAIYRREYWDACACESVPEAARFHVFDAAVNSGCVQAVKWLQRALSVGDDGKLGSVTLTALQSADGDKLASRYNGYRLDFMTSLPTWATFGKGWSRRIASNLMAA